MSKKLLINLNGNKNGIFKKYLDSLKNEPRIAWYPSAGTDFRALMYLHPNYLTINLPRTEVPKCPDIFLFTDYFPWQSSTFLDNKIIYSDEHTTIEIVEIEELPRINLPLHAEIVEFPKGSSATNRVVFMTVNVKSDEVGNFMFPVLYVFAENEAFYCEKLVPYSAKLSHIIHVRYGGGLGGGGNATGAWLLNVLPQLGCEVFITDGSHKIQSGDVAAMELCPKIPKTTDLNLNNCKIIIIIRGEDWSDYGDVSWYKID